MLPERTYDAGELASALQDAINASSWLSTCYTCIYNAAKQTITISRPESDQSFFMVNDDLLSDPGFQDPADPRTALFEAYNLDWSSTKSAHELLGLGQKLLGQQQDGAADDHDHGPSGPCLYLRGGHR